MSFLYFLQELRNPVADAFFSVITLFGEEAFFLLIALVFYWCIDKGKAYYLLVVSFVGMAINQCLKLIFRIPRPWVLDPDFPIVESAREAAAGYSFPSGHTQSATNVFGVLGRSYRHRALRVLCIVLILLTAFSRMYLGVHTPLDVVVSLLISGTLVFLLYPLMQRASKQPRLMYLILGVLLLIAVAYVTFVEIYTASPELCMLDTSHEKKSAWTLLGCASAVPLIYTLDVRFIRFRTQAPLPAHLFKCVLGVALTMLVKELLRAPLLSLFDAHPVAHAVRYFLVIVFAGSLWPLTFPLWTRLFTKKQ